MTCQNPIGQRTKQQIKERRDIKNQHVEALVKGNDNPAHPSSPPTHPFLFLAIDPFLFLAIELNKSNGNSG